jgi:hypothetical protein
MVTAALSVVFVDEHNAVTRLGSDPPTRYPTAARSAAVNCIPRAEMRTVDDDR